MVEERFEVSLKHLPIYLLETQHVRLVALVMVGGGGDGVGGGGGGDGGMNLVGGREWRDGVDGGEGNGGMELVGGWRDGIDGGMKLVGGRWRGDWNSDGRKVMKVVKKWKGGGWLWELVMGGNEDGQLVMGGMGGKVYGGW